MNHSLAEGKRALEVSWGGSKGALWGSDSSVLLPACLLQTGSQELSGGRGRVLQTLKLFRGSKPSPQTIRDTQVPAKVSVQGQRAGLCSLDGIEMSTE